MTKHLLVLSTGQHVGKTTLSLGLVKHLQTKFYDSGKQVAYCKPVGQQHVAVDRGLRVDKVRTDSDCYGIDDDTTGRFMLCTQ